ncbi:MAG TPA: DedA family protein [Spirochaetia bacterium]|nr:DedA family protein [Spirochaetia bacterium]
MQHILHILQPLFDRYGYLAVFMTIFLEDFGVPMPGETTLVVGSLLAARGGLNIFAFAGIAWAAAVLGDNVGYAIGRYGARSLILGVGRFIFLSERKVEAVERVFRRWGPLLVIVSRFIELLRQLNGIVAGMVRMPWRRFLAFNALGAGLWVAFWATLAFELGLRVRSTGSVLRHLDLLFIALFVVAAVSILLSRLILQRRSAVTEPRS